MENRPTNRDIIIYRLKRVLRTTLRLILFPLYLLIRIICLAIYWLFRNRSRFVEYAKRLWMWTRESIREINRPRINMGLFVSIVKSRWIWIFAGGVAGVFLFIHLHNNTSTVVIGDGTEAPMRKVQPKAINQHITNSMSELESTKAFDREITQFMRKWDLKGASFALMHDDKLIYAKGYGYADKEAQIKCEVKNTFRLASVSKLITATAIMKLIEQGKLTLKSHVFGADGILNEPVFLDLQSKNQERITVEHLLRHTAGFSTPIQDPAFSNYTVARILGKELPLSVDDMVLYATKNRLKARPGDRYDYSNLGYIILGKVIEVVSGMGYEEYVQENILHPAECYNMYIGNNYHHNSPEDEVRYYEVKEAELVGAYDGKGQPTMKSDGGNNISLLSSAGGWVASPVELLRFVASINGHSGKRDVISMSSVKAMTEESSRYKPMGWASVRGGGEWIRSGSMAGTCAMMKKQKNGYTWIFVTNSSSWTGYRLSNSASLIITRALTKVKEWPDRDMFEIAK